MVVSDFQARQAYKDRSKSTKEGGEEEPHRLFRPAALAWFYLRQVVAVAFGEGKAGARSRRCQDFSFAPSFCEVRAGLGYGTGTKILPFAKARVRPTRTR